MSRVLNFVIISMILAAGLVTFPAQASRPCTPMPVLSIPQQIPGNEAQIVENDTTVQVPDSYNRTLTEMLGPEGYNFGYNHGCSDAHEGGHPYLYGSGGASNHTTVFMQGYNDGWRNCTTSVESRSPSIEIPLK